VLAEHTYAHRAVQVEGVLGFTTSRKASPVTREQVA
jgi:hypothetical protein